MFIQYVLCTKQAIMERSVKIILKAYGHVVYMENNK
jgi:hypothetical protein